MYMSSPVPSYLAKKKPVSFFCIICFLQRTVFTNDAVQTKKIWMIMQVKYLNRKTQKVLFLSSFFIRKYCSGSRLLMSDHRFLNCSLDRFVPNLASRAVTTEDFFLSLRIFGRVYGPFFPIVVLPSQYGHHLHHLLKSHVGGLISPLGCGWLWHRAFLRATSPDSLRHLSRYTPTAQWRVKGRGQIVLKNVRGGRRRLSMTHVQCI